MKWRQNGFCLFSKLNEPQKKLADLQETICVMPTLLHHQTSIA